MELADACNTLFLSNYCREIISISFLSVLFIAADSQKQKEDIMKLLGMAGKGPGSGKS